VQEEDKSEKEMEMASNSFESSSNGKMSSRGTKDNVNLKNNLMSALGPKT